MDGGCGRGRTIGKSLRSFLDLIFKGEPIDFSKCLKEDEMDKYCIGAHTCLPINMHTHTQNITVGEREHTIYTWKLQLSV